MNDMLVDALGSAFTVVLVVSAPILIIGLVVSLVTSLLQAMTQVQEQTLSLVPRLLAMLVAIFTIVREEHADGDVLKKARFPVIAFTRF